MYWAANNSGTKFVSEEMVLPAGSFTMSKYISEEDSEITISTMQVTNGSTLHIPYMIKQSYSGSNISVKPEYRMWNKVEVTFSDGTSYTEVYTSGNFKIEYNPLLIKSVRFYKD